MNLRTLLNDPQVPDVDIVGLCEHTDEVQPGYAFCAVSEDPRTAQIYCRDARDKGATVLLLQPGVAPVVAKEFERTAVTCVEVSQLARRRGQIAARFYANPSAAMTCVGVTGTNGKTSTAYHVADLFSILGLPCAYIGTLGVGQINAVRELKMTTPNPVALQRYLAEQKCGGSVAAAVEVSSHALDQKRAHDVQFDYGIFTNLSRDHLDYHGSMAAYKQAKSRLFTDWSLKAAVINVGDKFGQTLADLCPGTVVTFGRGGDWQWELETPPAGEVSQVRWTTPHGVFDGAVNVAADYAVANITAALATAVEVGLPPGQVMSQAERLAGVPGRMEVLKAGPRAPMVVVDYAHTPDALEKVLAALATVSAGRVICVVGCGGDRDQGKRPQMGAIADRLADRVWLTADNPRSEEPLQIIEQMQHGMVGLSEIHIQADRGAAIAEAILAASADDVVLVAGKGHEPYQEVAGKRLKFDDRVIARQVLEGLH